MEKKVDWRDWETPRDWTRTEEWDNAVECEVSRLGESRKAQPSRRPVFLCFFFCTTLQPRVIQKVYAHSMQARLGTAAHLFTSYTDRFPIPIMGECKRIRREGSTRTESASPCVDYNSFIRASIPHEYDSHTELEPCLQKICQRLQCPGEKSYS